MEFRLFGEIQLRAGSKVLDVGTPRQQAVLAALAVDAGRPVPIETLIDRVWDDAPPVEARNVLYSHLSRIRQLLKHAAEFTGVPARIERRSAGYVLDIDPDQVDIHRFGKLVEQAGAGKLTDADRVAVLTEALELWHGVPLAGVPGDWVARTRDSLLRRRLNAVVRRGELELALGRTAAVIADLPDLVAEYPLAEPLEGLLMRALHAAGRDAEALARYADLRRRLADELGTDPGPELRALHAAILRGELPAQQRDSPLATPAQLPADLFGFAGRAEELRRLDAVLGNGSPAARIVAVAGTAGVGKTTLVVHWAHRVRGEFPDGQLYVNLRGFDPTGSPVTSASAVREFLDAFEVPAHRIPAGFEAQVGLYRSLLAERRVLVVLDNARDTEQVRQLLPGAPGCLAVVSSRNLLSGLVAGGAHPLSLDLLDAGDARALLAERLGAARVVAEPVAVEEIVRLCARLPLALAVVAARAATHPGFGLAALAGELRAASGGLDEFAADPATDPRAVFSWSYLQLSADAARLFRLIGLHPGPDIGTRAAASLAGLPAVRPLLLELARAHLVAEHAPGRYSCHDLLRAYASEQASLLDSDTERGAATRRVIAHYVHSADNGDRLLDPRRDEPPTLPELPPGVRPEQMADHGQALAWFDAELGVLLAMLRQPVKLDPEVWALAWAMRRFLAYQGHWQNELDTLTIALFAAQRLGDPVRQAFAQCHVGCAHVWLGRYEEARSRLDIALELFREADSRAGEAYVQHHYSWMLDRQQRVVEALAHAERGLLLYESAGHRAGQAKALNAVGWFHSLLGDHRKAVTYCEKALALQRELGDELAAAQTWHSLGHAHHHLGDHQQAMDCYQTSIKLFRGSGYRHSEANTLISLGDAHDNAGAADLARDAWQQALDILDQLGHPDADKARARLQSIHSRQ